MHGSAVQHAQRFEPARLRLVSAKHLLASATMARVATMRLAVQEWEGTGGARVLLTPS